MPSIGGIYAEQERRKHLRLVTSPAVLDAREHLDVERYGRVIAARFQRNTNAAVRVDPASAVRKAEHDEAFAAMHAACEQTDFAACVGAWVVRHQLLSLALFVSAIAVGSILTAVALVGLL